MLPFLNLSADPGNEYFSDGISEEILNALTKVEGLRVCSRTSSFAFKGQQQDVRQIGQKLGVAAVLEGSVRRGGNRVRISAQLVSSIDGYHIWSETFDGDLDDIFRVQDDIAGSIATSLKVKLSTGDRAGDGFDKAPGASPSKAPTENLEAYNLYLKGRFYWNKSTPEDTSKAIKTFEAAIALDPEFALPYCMLSHCYSFMGSSGLMPYAEAFSKAKDSTLRAIEIDPNHAESHLSLATIKFLQNWDFSGAELSLDKARDLGLNSSLLNQIHGLLLITKGRYEEAIDKVEEALSQEPTSLSLMCMLGDAFSFARRFEKALAEYDKVIEMDPNFRRAYEGKGLVYLATENFEQAVQYLDQYQKLIGDPLKGLAGLGYAHARAGNLDKAHECLLKTQQREKTDVGVDLNIDYALLYAGLGEYDKTVDFIATTYAQRTGVVCTGMIYCIRYPILHELKSDARFRELTAKMGLELA